jgi:ATP-dependent Zn protease
VEERVLARFCWTAKGREQWRLRRTAYHEAGHAVIAYHQQRRLERVSIVSHWRGSGQVEYREGHEWTGDDEALLEAELVSLMAGAAAQNLWIGTQSWGSLPDQVQAWCRARVVRGTPGDFPACRARAREQATALLVGSRAAVEALVAELLVAQEIDGPKAWKIIARALAAGTE